MGYETGFAALVAALAAVGQSPQADKPRPAPIARGNGDKYLRREVAAVRAERTRINAGRLKHRKMTTKAKAIRRELRRAMLATREGGAA